MYISKFRVVNFKSYEDSGEITFTPGFNVVTGQNSAGKTSLLDAITLQFPFAPHRSSQTVPLVGSLPVANSFAQCTFVISGPELSDLIRIAGQGHWFFAPPIGQLFHTGKPYDGTREGMNRALSELVGSEELPLPVSYQVSQTTSLTVEGNTYLGAYKPPINPDGAVAAFRVSSEPSRGVFTIDNSPSLATKNQDIRVLLAQKLRERIYRFKAERFNLGESPSQGSPQLVPDARNLPSVLLLLQANRDRFNQLNELIRLVLPQIKQVSVRPLANNNAEILVWSHDPSTQRIDLAIPLDECGSGVGQVLAMLYVVANSDHPRVIIVDEPQSFLHPGAIRKLVEVLKKFPQHQYIFATHSPTVITASNPATFTIARTTENQTTLEVADPKNASVLQLYLAEIGARLGDVFGADNVLWVEGQTEELCFPMILNTIASRSLMGTAILGIRKTGDLQGRDRQKVIEMYQRLSGATSLLPPAIAFIFDSECLTAQQRQDLTKMDPEHVHFLPRRMYENYLLDEDAVAATMNTIEGFRDSLVSAAEVRSSFEAKRDSKFTKGRPQYFCDGLTKAPDDWKDRIDAARILSEAFQDLSENRVSYEKTTHSVAITKWLLDNRPEDLKELAKMLVGLLGPN
jgi:hypothetical protein